jgi:hypothetical protein
MPARAERFFGAVQGTAGSGESLFCIHKLFDDDLTLRAPQCTAKFGVV